MLTFLSRHHFSLWNKETCISHFVLCECFFKIVVVSSINQFKLIELNWFFFSFLGPLGGKTLTYYHSPCKMGLCIYTYGRHRVTLVFIWSHVCIHLMNVIQYSPSFSSASTNFWEKYLAFYLLIFHCVHQLVSL